MTVMCAWRPWLVTLAYLLTLSNPRWVVAALLTARNPQLPWFQTLAHLVFREQSNIGSLAHAIYDLDYMAAELERALPGPDPQDPLVQWLGLLNHEFSSQTEDERLWVDIANAILIRQPFHSPLFPLVTTALAALQNSAMDCLHELAVELRGELLAPSVAALTEQDDQSPCPRLVGWLMQLAPTSVNENSPAVIDYQLRSIHPRPLTRDDPGTGVSRESLLECLMDGFEAGTGPREILRRLILGDAWPDIINDLGSYMPCPEDLDQEQLRSLRQRLNEWLVFLLVKPAEPCQRMVDHELHPDLNVVAVQEALIQSGSWEETRPPCWPAPASGAWELAMRAALSSLWLDDLARRLSICCSELRPVPQRNC